MFRSRYTSACALLFVLGVLLPAAVFAQATTGSEANPLVDLKVELTRVLSASQQPFTEDQEKQVTLMMEDRLRASETLFGGLMDFRGGPTSGQNAQQLQSAIGWLRNEFLTRVREYLNTEQLTAWDASRRAATDVAPGGRGRGAAPGAQQTQFVRINNNRFTAEDQQYSGGGFGGGGGGGGDTGGRGGGGGGTPGGGGGGGQVGGGAAGGGGFVGGGRGGGSQGTEVIQRGGQGAWHGTVQNLFKDDALNARNVFADNKPPYQERQLSTDIGGPVIPGRLTTNLTAGYTLTQNVDTVNAILPTGLFSLGITRPTRSKSVGTRNTIQLANAHVLSANVSYVSRRSEDENVGDFTLPERASDRTSSSLNADFRQFSALGSGSIYETRVGVFETRSEVLPFLDAVRINVTDTFNSGGAQNRADETRRTVSFGNLYTRPGQTLTIKTGIDGFYQYARSFSTANYGGTYTFASLADYIAGAATTYRQSRGEPLHETTHWTLSGFMQTDWALSRRTQVMFGVRYDVQTQLKDHNNVSPRFGFAYSAGRGYVIRGGLGQFYNSLQIERVILQERFDGTRQFEVVIDKPLFPDPFTGTVRQTFPSIRVTDPNLRSSVDNVAMMSLEKTFFRTFLTTFTYDYQDQNGRYAYRDVNQPYDTTFTTRTACSVGTPTANCVRPDPTLGSVLKLGNDSFQNTHTLRASLRHRFSIFNWTSNYTYQNGTEDNMDFGLSSNSYDPRADWSTRGMPRHQWSGSVNARLPLGVFLTQSYSLSSGRFYSITTGKDDNRDGTSTDRPVGVARNSEIGPSRVNFDLNVSKAIFFSAADSSGTRKNLNVFLNVTNQFNKVHYGQPSGVLSSSNFGIITSAFDPREVEIGLRYQF
jgi:hypothetical protein